MTTMEELKEQYFDMLQNTDDADYFKSADEIPDEIVNSYYDEWDHTYGCDICCGRFDFDDEIWWITSSYGVCRECYEKLTEEQLEQIRRDYE